MPSRKTIDFLLRANRDVAAAKAFFQRAFESQRRLPRAITLDGYQASHRAAREFLGEHRRGGRTEVRSSKYLNNLIEQDHDPSSFVWARCSGSSDFGVRRSRSPESSSCIGSGKVNSHWASSERLSKTAPEMWNAVLAA